MRICNEQLARNVFFAAAHAGNAASAAALCAVRVERLALYVAEVRQCQDAVFLRDEVFHVHFAGNGGDLRAALVAEALFHLHGFILDDTVAARFACDDVEEIGDFEAQCGKLFLELCSLKAGQLAEAHLHDGLCLHIVKAEALHEGDFAFRDRLGISQDGDDFIDEVERDHEAFQNVGALLRLFKVELRAAQHNFTLELDVFLQNIAQGEQLRLAVYNGQHDDTERDLHLRERIQVVQNELRGSLTLDVDGNVHTVAVGMIVDIGDAVDALILDKLCDVFDESCFVDLIRQLGDDDLVAAIRLFHNLCAGTHVNSAAAGAVCGANAAAAHNDAAGREIRSLNVLHEAVKVNIGVIHHSAHAIKHFAHVVRRNVRRHTDGDTCGAVYEDIREMRGQHVRLFQTVVVVRGEIDRVLLNILQHFHRKLTHASFRVTVCSRRVAVYGTEVAVAVNEHIAHGKILRKTHQRVINRSIAVRMVAAQYGTDGIRALSVSLFRPQSVFIHGVENTAVDRL